MLSLSLVRVILKLITLPGTFVAIKLSDFSSLSEILVVNIDLFFSLTAALVVNIYVFSF